MPTHALKILQLVPIHNLFLKLSNYEYFEQESIAKDGYIEVIEDSAFDEDEKFVNVASKIAALLQEGVNSNDIAILTYTNADVLNLYYYLIFFEVLWSKHFVYEKKRSTKRIQYLCW